MAKNEKRFIGVIGDKGGTGKSLVSRLIWERLRSLGKNARAFDADGTTGSFVQFYGAYDTDGNLITPQPSEGVTPILLHGSDKDRDEIASTLDTGADVVLVDFPATSLTVLQRLESEWGFFAEAGRAGYQVTLVNVITPYSASLGNVRTTFDIAPTAKNVVIRNLGFGDYDDFILWDGSEKYGIPKSKGKKMLEERGGVEIGLPGLKPTPLVLIDLWNLTFSDALDDKRFTLPDRSRIRRWLDEVYSEFADANGLLGLSSPAPVAAVAK